MNMCPANKHDMDVVGIKQRSDRSSGVCRGCQNERNYRCLEAANEDSWRLPEVYDLDTRQLIVDEIAIERAVSGERGKGAWITQTEATEAFNIMLRRGYEYSRIAEHIGCDNRTIERWATGGLPNPASPVKPRRYLLASEMSPAQLAVKRANDAERSRNRRANGMYAA